MRWLQNPSVALIQLLASVIAVVQSVVWLCRYISRLLQAEGARFRHIRLAVALVSLVLVVAASVVTWPVLFAEAAKNGDHGVIGAMYPLEFVTLGLSGAAVLLYEAGVKAQERYYSSMAYNVLAVTLATMAAAYFFRTSPIGSGLTASAPSLGLVVMLFAFFRFLQMIRARAGQAKGQ